MGFWAYLEAYKTSLLRMLEVESMPLRNLPIHSLLHPHNLIDKIITPFVHLINRPAVFRINHPDEQKPTGLELTQRDIGDQIIIEARVANSDSSGGL